MSSETRPATRRFTPCARGGDRHGRFGMREVDHRSAARFTASDGSSRTPIGFIRLPTSTRCTAAYR